MTERGGPGLPPGRDRVKVRAEPAPTHHASPKGEVIQDGNALVGTFYLPMHEPHEVKYHVGRRTITLWSRKEGREFQTILVLPKWVRPETFILAHHNGVYEFLLEPVAEPR